MPDIRPDLSPQDQFALNLYTAARGYKFAAQILPKSSDFAPRAETMVLPTMALQAFSIELFLKSFLAKQGVTEKELSGHVLRHDLCALGNRAIAGGLSHSPALDLLIGILAEQHKKHGYRYMKSDTTYLTVSYPDVHKVLDELDGAVAAYVDVKSMLAPA